MKIMTILRSSQKRRTKNLGYKKLLHYNFLYIFVHAWFGKCKNFMGGGLSNWTQIIKIINSIIRVNTKHEKIIIDSKILFWIV